MRNPAHTRPGAEQARPPLEDLERTATVRDAESRSEIGETLWHTNHRLLTDARALRARLRPQLTGGAGV
ncbi:hypothetical protein J2W21_001713 [Sinomonas atrocyanea]|uniref:hypothetical protein n=1 Tax=Sinomonas atrocyanea TaxID=37927 RepID=UPI002788ABD1|nr:hypothetical protein [Sinomonas atrocyanea]MDP9884203.1 hypothetical protein [Sinomonas atrocyanea]